MGLLHFLFGNTSRQIDDFKSRGAMVLDVRSKTEYENGHIQGSKHIPLQEISAKTTEIKQWGKPIITCCASGVRSASAAKILKNQGIEAINGGGWQRLNKKL